MADSTAPEPPLGRPRTLSREEAVERARDAFWEHGYQALGIRAIETMTGINRFAIRTEHGGKEGLFLAALSLYLEQIEHWVLAPMAARSDLDAIVEMLEGLVAPHEGSNRGFGCLIVNTAVENAALGSEPIGERVASYFDGIGDAVTALLERVRAAGALREDVSIEDARDFVVGTVVGTTLVNRRAGDMTAGAGFVRMAIRTVRGWGR